MTVTHRLTVDRFFRSWLCKCECEYRRIVSAAKSGFRVGGFQSTDPGHTSTTVAGPVGKRLQAGTEDAPVLDRPHPLRRLHDPDLLTYRV